MPGVYDQNFYAWTQDQAEALRKAAAGDAAALQALDWENLAEEIDSLGRSRLDAMESALVRIIEHLLKLRYSPAPYPRKGWIYRVRSHRITYQRLKQRHPGLVGRIDFEAVYGDAREFAEASLEQHDGMTPSPLPDLCPFTLAEIEDKTWLP